MHPNQEKFFTQIYRENFWKLRRYACIYLNENQAEEIVQDTFFEATKKIEILLEHENVGGWLMNTLKNKIQNFRRQNQKDLLRFVSLDSEMVLQISTSENTENIVEEKETFEITSQKIRDSLSQEELYLLKRIVFDNASHKEVSSELGISVWSSQKRLERIRGKLDKMFPDYRK